MTLEIRPMGVQCNLRCRYCYQNYERDNHTGAGQIEDLEEFKARLDKPFTLFGGEPLLTPPDVLEDLFKFGKEKFGYTGIQTNGSLITDEHIRMFKKYNVHVGLSVDGDEDLNDYRWAGSLEKTREMTKKTNDNIKKLIDNGISVSIIATIHKANATREKIPRFKAWLKKVNALGVSSIRLHTLEKDGAEADDLALNTEENLEAFLEFMDIAKDPNFNMKIRFRDDIINLLKGEDGCVTCTFNFCDPFKTDSVTDLNSNGASGCGRVHKDGYEWIKTQKPAQYVRELLLYQTPQKYGGCKGCKYFLVCKGYCNGSGLDDDWRNRSEYCDMLKELFSIYEEKLRDVNIQPITDHPQLKRLEEIIMGDAEQGKRTIIRRALQILESKPSNETSCKPKVSDKNTHRDRAHGDSFTHRDSDANKKTHRDHSDTVRRGR